MDVKRYDYGGGMMEFDTGPYVRFDDYAALLAECDRLRSRVAVLEARPENAIVAGLEYEAAQLRAERDAAIRERDELRSDLRQIAATCGGAISPEASHEFHRHVPEEVAALAAKLAEYEALVIPAWKREESGWIEMEARLTKERDTLRRVLDIIKDYCDSDVQAYAGHSVEELVEMEANRGK